MAAPPYPRRYVFADLYSELLYARLTSPHVRATALDRHMAAIDRKRILVFSMELV